MQHIGPVTALRAALAALLILPACTPRPAAPTDRQTQAQPTPATQPLFACAPDPTTVPVEPWNLAATLTRPAGQHGPIRAASDGHLYEGSRRIRFYGTNTMGLPPAGQDDLWADQIAGCGFNAVRFHGMDRPDAIPSTAFADRFDRFFAKLKERGIYTDFNWISHARLSQAEGFSPEVAALEMKTSHVLFFFDPQAQARQKQLARNFFTRRNPYTKLTYAEDPALAVVEIINEHGLTNSWHDGKLEALPETCRRALVARWAIWLKAKYPAAEALRTAWSDPSASFDTLSLPLRANRKTLPPARLGDWLEFLRQTERDYYRQMRDFLRKDLGVKALVIASIAQMTTPQIAADQDIVDLHEYWNYPHFELAGGGPGHMDANRWYTIDPPFVNDGQRKFAFMARFRIRGKPLFLSEYNDCSSYPNSGPGLLLYAAYASLQDWDGLFLFSWTGTSGRIDHVFEIANHPAAQAHARAASLLFREQLVAPARDLILLPQPEAREKARLIGGNAWDLAPIPGQGLLGALVHRTAVDLTAPDPGESAPRAPATQPATFTSDTGQLAWHPGDAPAWTLQAPRICAFVGQVPAHIAVGELQLAIEPTLDHQAAIVFVLTEGEDLQHARAGLLLATARSQNTGESWGPYTGRPLPPDPRGRPRMTILNWGTAPALAEPVRATLEWPVIDGSRLRVWALDPAGRRLAELPVTTINHRAHITLGHDPAIAFECRWEKR